ncbi:MAG: isocitrate/isopropylmalate family dehydrogenase [Spirochaetaceae bacterium]|nr:isocitrate/isopropylmalate family dehydrogenase [Spirochaetaceae bacterium]
MKRRGHARTPETMGAAAGGSPARAALPTRLLVLPGDGVGPEITEAAVAVLDAVADRWPLDLERETAEIGLTALAGCGTTLPDGTLERARAADGVILGPIDHMRYPARDQGGVNVSATLRTGLDLYANIRPARTRPGLSGPVGDFDLVIVRENTEGFYPDRNMYAGSGEFMPDADTALSVRKISAAACRRIARRSFTLARRRRGKVTAVHKANNFILSDGLFLREVRAVASDYPDVELDEVLVDAAAALLVREPARFDVLCTTNFHGDILSDLASELSGSLGLAGSLNAGDRHACAQAQHGSAPDIAGRDRVNPTAMLLSMAMLLEWLAERHGRPDLASAATRITSAVDRTLTDPATRTADLGGCLGARAFTAAVIAALE